MSQRFGASSRKKAFSFRPRLECLEGRLLPSSYYTVTYLPNLVGGPTYALAISGQDIAGYSGMTNGSFHAFLYKQGTMTDLGTLGGDSSYAYGISGDIVVGYSNTSGSQGHVAFVYQNGTMTSLGDLGGGFSEADAVSKAGIVGDSTTAAGYNHAFLYQNGTMTDIGTLGGNYSYAYGINDSGEVVGASTLAGDQFSHAFSWQNGVFTDLGVLPNGNTSEAFAINNSGLVTGAGYIPGNYYHAFLYQNGTMNDLGTLSNLHYSAGYGINDVGQVVGTSSDHDVAYGILDQNNAMTPINNLLNPTGNYYIGSAAGISNNGQIIGQDFTQTAVVLTPPATTMTWTGAGGDNLWSDGANWSGNGGLAPAPGDTLVFGPGASQQSTFDDLDPNTSFNAIRFTGAGYTVNGNPLDIKGSIDASASTGANTLNDNLTLAAKSTIAMAGSATSLTFGGTIDNAGFNMQVTGTGGAVRFDGSISGGGSLTDSNSGTVTLVAGNAYSGGTTLSAGALALGSSSAVGTGTFSIKGGTLEIGSKALTLANAMTVGANFKIVGNNSLGFSGATAITGNRTITISNAGGLTFSGPVSLGGNLTINSGSLTVSGATTLTASRTVTINSGATAVMGVITQSGTIARSLTKSGTGTLTLSAANTYTGPTTVSAGTLLVNGSVAGAVTVKASATLGGAGTTGAVTVLSGGNAAPGSVTATAILNTGSLMLNSGSNDNVALDGGTAGSGYDQINVSGTVSLNGSKLNVTLGFVATVGATFTIINNDGTDAVTGTFAGLVQGATFVVGGETFQISYKGGDGNDVTLTCTQQSAGQVSQAAFPYVGGATMRQIVAFASAAYTSGSETLQLAKIDVPALASMIDSPGTSDAASTTVAEVSAHSRTLEVAGTDLADVDKLALIDQVFSAI
jgi:autotransporter-associated beta strand protein/probable HAF family extracellular repeat protein